ncbi:MAG: uracil-DNA glycosylase family protein [Deltaproteobacteria bacterium]|nr:uracil-DNA glycosylase family protein [Deltaproteobacteria bacterium]MCB9478390.1 uracil-DNA glycosylase family protein [Deltaproteobacteria bacterium]
MDDQARRPRKNSADAQTLDELLVEIRACRHCEADLPLGPRPVLRAASSARILVVGQAPGTRVHATGIPWNDPSGDRLREWMGVDRETFYDRTRIAIIPMGLCYPGKGKSGDLPPRKECAELWFDRLHVHLPNIRLTLLCGQYAQKYYLGKRAKGSLTETVRAWREYAPEFIPMPHPSPRNLMWRRRNPWFEAEVVPAIAEATARLIG